MRKVGDRVLLKAVPGRWRIVSIGTDGWVSIEGQDKTAQDLARMDPSGIVSVRSRETIPDTTDQGELS